MKKLYEKLLFKVITYSIPFFIVGIIYLRAYYPGIMTVDSIEQWNQMMTFKFNDWHPVMHTLFNFLITRIWYCPAAIVFVQIVMISLGLGYALAIYEKIGINKIILILMSIAFSIFPANGFMSMCVWKDIPYSAGVLFFTALMINLVYCGEKVLEKKSFLILLVICSLGVLFFRHNGIIVVLGTYLIMSIVIKKKRKVIFLTLVGLISVLMLIKGPIYKNLNVIPTEKSEALGVCVNSIGNIVKNNGYVTKNQKKELDKILPYDIWGKAYSPYRTDAIKFSKGFNSKKISKKPLKFVCLWFDIAKNNPRLTLESYLNQMMLIWKVKGVDDQKIGVLTYVYPSQSDQFKSTTKNQSILTFLENINKWTSKNRWLFWRPALAFYLTIIILVTNLILTRNKKIILIASPIVFNVLGMLIAMPAPDYRYLYSNTLVFFAVLPMLFLLKRKKGEINE